MLDSKPDNDGAIIYLPPFRNRRDIDIEITMKDLILRSNGDRLSTYPMRGIELIPLKDVFKEIVCSSSTCQIVFDESVSASTTNSFEVSLSIDARAKPFGVGMTFASTSEATTTLVYNIELVRGDRGYIGMANAYLSAKMRVKGCIYPFNAREVGQCILHIVLLCERHEHETVITKNGVTRGLVAFTRRYRKGSRRPFWSSIPSSVPLEAVYV
ncbi:hypothetical protein BG005_006650 [Podila minutissima]|nr:hypothetical protein BG005_006650 [Podila minutissima]